jgi:UDP-glucose 4-epimerase
MSERILLLGGNGFIGRNLALELLKAGKTVVVVDKKLVSGPLFTQHAGFVSIAASIEDLPALKEIIQRFRIQIVVNLVATLVPGSSAEDFFADMRHGFPAILELFQRLPEWGVHKLVQFSSGGAIYEVQPDTAYSEDSRLDPLSFYGWQKITLDSYIKLLAKRGLLEYLMSGLLILMGVFKIRMDSRALSQLRLEKCWLAKHSKYGEAGKLSAITFTSTT